ncbi:uncharacterized protein LOC105683128 [Athalia rosae]|uniref:uncharacterized protein LOC105683128 n=1 Tax=Athalia rosae TaxID=37344 RepID=UPI002034718F|nr:uncharacterized protein LOC105683128 [Athalia rosae]XP_020706431.2 uncharacterized protein LOC105683128 [Athalia rosae]XP_020706433.2 uncharacterized protein LOC105683128 [Athalia rosae]XP_048513644.1 uncharacterized protein LOC105683128 [Athalia rosae]
MMLHRSTSSRRRRASRSAANSPQGNNPSAVLPTTRGRRASVAVDRTTATTSLSSTANPQERSPRGSMVPDIALDDDVVRGTDEKTCQRMLPEIDLENSLRGSLQSDLQNRSPRCSLVPDQEYCRSPRGSLVPETNRSPRNSLTPEINRSPRNSLVPDAAIIRSPRHSLVPDAALSPRNSLVPADAAPGYGSRSQRNSLVRNTLQATHGEGSGVTRNSLMPEDCSPVTRGIRHNSIACDGNGTLSPRGSCANISNVTELYLDRGQRGSEISKTPRGSIAPTPTEVNHSPRGSIVAESINRSPRGSIAPDPSRSPRGSISQDLQLSNRSPRGSINIAGAHEINRSPRGSTTAVGEVDRNHKSVSAGSGEGDNRSPRGSVGAQDVDRSPRGSLGGAQDRRSPRGSFAFQEPRRASADQGTWRNRSTSPYRQRERERDRAPDLVRDRDPNAPNTGTRYTGNYGAQVNLGYGTNAWADSRRASSSVSQFSGDESRRLCGGVPSLIEKGGTGGGTLAVATYGSLAFQLKDAHLEASGTCDFVSRALSVVGKTLVVTVCLGCLTAMPLLMLIMGLQFIRDCPREPYIPVYMVVGGTLGGVRMSWALYAQIRSRRPEVLSVPGTRSHMSPTRLASLALSIFLTGWFVLGNIWILNIRWPDYAPTLFEPNRWCHKTLYIFSLVHLCIVYATVGASLITAVALAICRIFACPWPDGYK